MKQVSKRFLVTIGIILLATLLRMPLLNASLWLDEAAQVMESARPLSQQLQIRDDFQPPLIHLLVHGLLQFSDQEWWLRTGAALIPGLVTIAALIWVGRSLGQQHAGRLAALLMATSSFHIFYSQELRPYSLPAMFCVLGWGVTVKLLQLKVTPNATLLMQWLAVWVICHSLGLYASYLYPFALFGQVMYLGWYWQSEWQKLVRLMAACLVITLSFLPWLPKFLDQLHAGQALRLNFPGWQEVVSFTQAKSIALVGGKFVFGILDLSTSPFFMVVISLLGVCGGVLSWQLWRRRTSSQFIATGLPIFICWLALPILAAWIVSFVVPVIQPKRVLFALPVFYLAVSWIIIEQTQVIKKNTSVIGKSAAYTLLAILLSINLYSTTQYFHQPKYQREDWRGVHRYISQKYLPSESVVVFAFPDQFVSWAWYNQVEQYPTVATGVFVTSKDPAAKDRLVIKGLTRYRYILVFDYLRDLSDPDRIIEQDLERYGYTEVDRITPSSPLGIIRVFAQTRQIIGSATYSVDGNN